MQLNRLQKLLVLLLITCGAYAVDCLVAPGDVADLPWFERGVFSLWPWAFPGTVVVFVVCLYHLLRKDR